MAYRVTYQSLVFGLNLKELQKDNTRYTGSLRHITHANLPACDFVLLWVLQTPDPSYKWSHLELCLLFPFLSSLLVD